MTDASATVSAVAVSTARSAPKTATAVGWAVATKGSVPRQLGLSRAALEANGFEGKVGQVLSVPTGDGVAVAVGIGDQARSTPPDFVPRRPHSRGRCPSTLTWRPT
jgi:hypothetical protein